MRTSVVISRITAFLVVIAVPLSVFAGNAIGRPAGGGSAIEWQTSITGHERVTLTVLWPDGRSLVKEFPAGRVPSLRLSDLGGAPADGQYNYELRVTPKVPPGLQKQLDDARAAGDDAAVQRIQQEHGLASALVQSGVVTILNGLIVSPDGVENDANDTAAAATGILNSVAADASRSPDQIRALDQVIPDDLIVQASICTGFDCVDAENFGFDTLRLKENNLRIHFEDTSTAAGYPANDWRIIANDPASGGANKLSIEDSTAARELVVIEAAAPANSLYVDSTGNIGLSQSAPILDLHMTQNDTPAIRMEQSNAGGFTAQTWDVAGNEANFFVRDVTGGSRLPFRIRPGAPTSSLDIAASGNVGIGTASPAAKLDVFGSVVIQSGGDLGIGTSTPAASLHVVDSISAAALSRMQNTSATGFSGISYLDHTGATRMYVGTDNAGAVSRIAAFSPTPLVFYTQNVERFRIDNGGNVGVGNSAPTQPFMVGTAGSGTGGNGAHVTTGGTWTNGSSRAFKERVEELGAAEAFAAVASLKPVRYNYKAEPQEQYVGFIAEEVPELVAQTSTGRQYLSPMDIVATLTKVVQEQQKTIEALASKVEQLEKKQ